MFVAYFTTCTLLTAYLLLLLPIILLLGVHVPLPQRGLAIDNGLRLLLTEQVVSRFRVLAKHWYGAQAYEDGGADEGFDVLGAW